MAALRDVVRADDPDFSEWARAMLDNEESDFSGEEGECVGPDFQSDHDSESEQGLSDNEEEHIPRNILVPKPSTSKKQYSAPSLVYMSDQEVEDPTPKKKRKRPKSYLERINSNGPLKHHLVMFVQELTTSYRIFQGS